MKLQTWLDENNVKPTRLANELGVAPSQITRALAGSVPKLELAVKIEDHTKGQVRPRDLLPDA